MPEFVTDNWLGLTVVALGILAAAFVVSEDAVVARRIFVRFVVNIALPLVIILGVPLALLAWYLGLDTRLLQALIAGLVIAAGWLTTAIFGELGKARDKAEKMRDYHKALYAEIRDTLSAINSEGEADQQSARLVARMEGNAGFVPFIPREAHDRVFTALVENIEVLPRQTIDAVVAYYSQIRSIAALVDDMRGATYAGLPQERRIVIYQDYVAMRQRAYSLGKYCLKLINAYASGGAASAEALSRQLNSSSNTGISTQAGGQSVLAPGSE